MKWAMGLAAAIAAMAGATSAGAATFYNETFTIASAPFEIDGWRYGVIAPVEIAGTVTLPSLVLKPGDGLSAVFTFSTPIAPIIGKWSPPTLIRFPVPGAPPGGGGAMHITEYVDGNGVQIDFSFIRSAARRLPPDPSAVFDTGGSYDVAGFAVPEPGVWTLMLAGLGLVGATLRRRHWQVGLPAARMPG